MINECYNWTFVGCCWKCGGNIWYNNDEDKYSFVLNDSDCLCELGVCGMCGKQTNNVTRASKVWQKAWITYTSYDWQLLHEDILVCSDCDELFCQRENGNCYIGEANAENKKIKEAA